MIYLYQFIEYIDPDERSFGQHHSRLVPIFVLDETKKAAIINKLNICSETINLGLFETYIKSKCITRPDSEQLVGKKDGETQILCSAQVPEIMNVDPHQDVAKERLSWLRSESFAYMQSPAFISQSHFMTWQVSACPSIKTLESCKYDKKIFAEKEEH